MEIDIREWLSDDPYCSSFVSAFTYIDGENFLRQHNTCGILRYLYPLIVNFSVYDGSNTVKFDEVLENVEDIEAMLFGIDTMIDALEKVRNAIVNFGNKYNLISEYNPGPTL